MKFITHLILIIFIVIMQSTLMPMISFEHAFPNLILIISLSLIFVNRVDEAVWWALMGGIFLDLLSPVHFGIFTFSLLLIILLFKFLTSHIFADPSLLLSLLFFFCASILSDLYFAISTSQYMLLIINGLFTMLVGGIIYGLIRYYFLPHDKIRI